ncbi:LysM domain-containing protein [Sphingomonas sp. NIBR02145]|uniref:LysM peptidoglycan-binding domain-containing protein n=1 Tax=Sphingomonas sp. NIBR02145 TaxID=3014784 RepID=UPI0022B2ECED|nr:LysM domain-containing protein [Sphingomonas sp. NIBR02145]WHU04262.1 LysM domain-containing protein [Sphingomonas sp. NIBR02145]
MSINSLYSAFSLAASRGEVSAAVLPLMGKLVAALGVEKLSLTQGDPSRLPAAAELTGVTEWPSGTRWTLKLIGTVEDGRDLLTLTLTAQTAKGFVALGTLVPALPNSTIAAPDTAGALMDSASVLTGLGPEQTVLGASALDDADVPAPRPGISGWLRLPGTSLSEYQSVMGAAELALAGTIDPRASALVNEKVDLVAVAPALTGGWEKIPIQQLAMLLSTRAVNTYSLAEPKPFVSSVEMQMTLTVNTGRDHNVNVLVPLLQGDHIWDIAGIFDPAFTLSDGLVALMRLFPGAAPATFQLPAGVAALDAFGLSALRYGVQTTGTLPVPEQTLYTGATITSTSAWNPPIPFVTVEEVGVNWLMNWFGPSPSWGATLFGTMRFGAKTAAGTGPAIVAGAPTDQNGDPVFLDVGVSLPDLSINAETRGVFRLGIVEAMQVFYPGTNPSVGGDLMVDYIGLSASIPEKTFGATLKAHGTWEIPVGNVKFTLDGIKFQFSVGPAEVWGGLSGLVGVTVGGETKAQLTAGAYYPGDGSWRFQGGLALGPLNLTRMAEAFLGVTAPSWLPSLILRDLWADYSTGPGNPYSVSAAVAVQWDPEVLGIKLALTAEAEVRRRPKAAAGTIAGARDAVLIAGLAANSPDLHAIMLADAANDTPAMIYEGKVKGSFEINNLIVSVGLSFVSSEMTWLFGLQLDRFSLEGRTAWIGEGAKRHQILTVEMQGVTLGAMIESLAALANPNANYRLEAPWTFLNSIDLGRFKLVIDPTEQAVSLDYAINLKLGFMTIKTVGLRYQRSTGEPQVDIEITGNFLGKDYGREPGMAPLAWDALNDSPPAIPGEGMRLIELRYLGFGQHVSLNGLTRPDSLSEIVKLMRAQLQPMDDPMRNPLDQPSGNQLHFDESSQWLIGLDVTLMRTVTVKLVMHDPDLYGVLVALAGPDAGTLAGFSFELLYKKVTDDIGVFHARLQVPDMFRQLDFGVVSITLGIITVDIFTNGNFKIDLGFPHGRDFTLSFGLSYGPFMGKGGIYFGYLNGDTSTSVPAITNGTFSPVLELGIGLAVGVGREFNKGPLKAGAYIQVEVIFEGVLAWFHPKDAAGSTSMYYWARGTAALVGKVYGKVDFKVISVDVSFEAYAAATLTLAAYRPTLIEMRVGVRVHASVKILFVRISFSFETSLDVSFAVGSQSTPPWILSADQSGRTPGVQAIALPGTVPCHAASHTLQAPRRRPADMARVTRLATLQRLQIAAYGTHALEDQAAMRDVAAPADRAAEADYRLNFSPNAKVYADGEIKPLDVRVVPALTIAAMPIAWPGGTVPTNPSPAYRVVLTCAMDGPGPAAAASLDEARTGAFAPTARARSQAETPFALFAEGLFRWSVSAIGLDPRNATLTAGDLAELARQMDFPQTFAQGFALTNLSGFLTSNVMLNLSGQPGGDADPETVSGVSFPIPPVIGWADADLPEPEKNRDFATYQPVDDAYAARIAAYFRKLSPQPLGDGNEPSGGIPGGEALAAVMFREYALLVAKSMVQAAQDLFAQFPVAIDTQSTLTDIAARFETVQLPYVVHAGDTVEQVAAAFGYGSAELLALNPGIVRALQITTPGSAIQVVLGVTPESIAAANPERPISPGKTIAAHALQTQILSGETPATLCARLGSNVTQWLASPAALDDPAITRAGAALALPAIAYPNPTELSLVQVAALFYVRFHAGTPVSALVPEAGWYAEAIAQLNPGAIDADGTLPATVLVPSAYDVLTNPVAWPRLAGDTLALIAAAAALWQNPAADPGFATWLAQVQADNPAFVSGAVNLPAAATALLPVEPLRALAARLLLVTDPIAVAVTPSAAFAALVAPAELLAPLASVIVTDCALLTVAGQTLRSFATTYDITVETVGRIASDVAGLIVPDPVLPLTVPTLTAVRLPLLIEQLMSGTPIRDVAGQVSRFMLQGQRLPAPGSDELDGMYALVGQQVSGPVPNSENPPKAVRLSLTLAKTATAAWLEFIDTHVVPPGGGGAMALAPDAALAARNPAVAQDRLRPGMILDIGGAANLVIEVTEAMLAQYPATTLAPVLPDPPRAMQLWEDVPVRHGLPQRVLWQTAVRPDFPALGAPLDAPAVGMPSLWPFTPALSAIAARGETKPWLVYRTDPERGPDAPAIPVEAFVWSTTIDIRLNRIPGRPHMAELVGADTAGRQQLLELWQYLKAAGTADTADLFFGFQLSPAAGLAAGIATQAGDPDATYLVRTNLSTETRSGAAASRGALGVGTPPPSGPYFAPMSNAFGFLTLLWEASVVGGGGYWLALTDAAGNGFDEAIWGQEGGAVVTLVAVLESQASAAPDRQLHSFNNAALLGVPIDTSATALFVAAPDDRELVRQATVAPGNVGFTVGITNPPDDGDTAELRARRLYNLAGYQLVETDVFLKSGAGQPVAAQVDRGRGMRAMRMAGAASAPVDDNNQTIAQVIPIHRYAGKSSVPSAAGLPPAALDPYAGIASGGGAMPVAKVTLGFHDIFGNNSSDGTAPSDARNRQ